MSIIKVPIAITYFWNHQNLGSPKQVLAGAPARSGVKFKSLLPNSHLVPIAILRIMPDFTEHICSCFFAQRGLSLLLLLVVVVVVYSTSLTTHFRRLAASKWPAALWKRAEEEEEGQGNTIENHERWRKGIVVQCRYYFNKKRATSIRTVGAILPDQATVSLQIKQFCRILKRLCCLARQLCYFPHANSSVPFSSNFAKQLCDDDQRKVTRLIEIK